MISNSITVQQLYNYALSKGYVDAEVTSVLSLYNKEINTVQPSSKIDFSDVVEYTVEDLLTLLSL